jgi:hypothetical protein
MSSESSNAKHQLGLRFYFVEQCETQNHFRLRRTMLFSAA